MRALPPPRNPKARAADKSQAVRKTQSAKSGLDPQFVAAAKASKKKFAPLFKRLAKT